MKQLYCPYDKAKLTCKQDDQQLHMSGTCPKCGTKWTFDAGRVKKNEDRTKN